MTLEETIRAVVREEIRAALRELRQPAPPATSAEPYLTIAQAAALACVGGTTVRDWLRAGKLNRYGQGKRVLINRAELERLLAPKPKPSPVLTDADLDERAERLARGH